MEFRVIDGCPAPSAVAPQIHMVLRRANQTASSIYRGDRAAGILHRHGKHTQREIHNDPRYAAISNPPGYSQHELFDGNGHPIPAWHVGVDSGSDSVSDKTAIENAARHYGWVAIHPYSRGVEGHHWCFAHEPKPRRRRDKLRIRWLRRRLPKR